MQNSKETFKLTELQREYLAIYHEYFVLKWDWATIGGYHNCTRNKISSAIHWTIDNRIKLLPEHMTRGAIDAINVRLKKNKELYDIETKKKRGRDNAFIIALNKEMREDEKTIYELEKLIQSDVKDESKLSSAQVLGLIKAAADIPENNTEN
ncbi:MAG: hypothetical protein WC438_05430 [Candidatus Pacearchaeota archaeon]